MPIIQIYGKWWSWFFIATHRQSFTECGFSINRLTSGVNMEEELIIVQKVIYDGMKVPMQMLVVFLSPKK